ncbi:MAG: cytochrome c [Thiomargarita sp.]|nr:cytochrome c [Thiomargarita sp.]
MKKTKIRNLYYGTAAFFILLFLALHVHTLIVLPQRDHRENITPLVAQGKLVWEENNCIGCHTLLGEGSYYAPELGNVYKRFHNSRAAIKGFLQSRPKTGVPGRRNMPQFNLSDKDLDAITAFLKWTSEIDTANWPPNIQG